MRAGFDAGGRARLGLPRRLHTAFARRRVAASTSPLVLADGMLAYLDTFPHGCTEQIISKAFPQLGLLQTPSFPLDRAAFGTLFDRTLTLLRSRQDATGGIRFWPSSAEAAPFPSVYVTHFMTDALALGMTVPDDMLKSALDYLRRIAGTTGDPAIGDQPHGRPHPGLCHLCPDAQRGRHDQLPQHPAANSGPRPCRHVAGRYRQCLYGRPLTRSSTRRRLPSV